MFRSRAAYRKLWNLILMYEANLIKKEMFRSAAYLQKRQFRSGLILSESVDTSVCAPPSGARARLHLRRRSRNRRQAASGGA
eukprot:326737-Prymnesium_polylepis.1